MSMDLTGITNQNEYYTNHYFSSIFEENASATIAAWRTVAKESEDLRTPWSLLRETAKMYYPLHDRYLRAKFDTQILSNIRSLADGYLNALGYPDAHPEWIEIDGTLKAPVYLEINKSNGAPLLWVLLAASEDKSAGILEKFCFSAIDISEESLSSIFETTLTTIENEDLATKILFGIAEPPRFLLFIGMNQIALIDRNKWNEKRYLQFELEEIFSRREETTLQAMAVLLHRNNLCPDAGAVLLDELDANSQRHAAGVSEDLKYALRESIELLGNEVLYDLKHRKGRDLDTEPVDAGQLTLECLRYMYRMLFILFIESRPELGYAPIKAQSYQSAYSLESLRDIADKIRDDLNEVGNGYYLHETLSKLYELIYNGYPKHEDHDIDYSSDMSLNDMFIIAPLKAHIFDPEYTKMITDARLRNSVLLRIIELMSLTQNKNRRNGRRGRISYANLGINQMGSVYEALLSYRGFIAEHTLFEVKRAGDSFSELDVGYFVSEEDLNQYTEDERVRYEQGENTGKLRRYEKGTFIYRLAGREREKSASYYTPEVLTKCLVKYALKELLENKSADDILDLTICEPAMGSAAFLNEAINQLAEAYLDKKQKELGDVISYENRFIELQKVKMFIADRNVFGVDLNPVAVELAEVSLWLNTIYGADFVPWFGNQLVNGNSLIGARRQCYRIEHLTTSSKGMRWFENAPDRVLLNSKRQSKKQIYHFLLGDPGMASYSDKVIKSLEPEKIKQMSQWNKNFNAPYDENDLVTLLRLSTVIDELWVAQVNLRKQVNEKTRDSLSIYGHDDNFTDSHTTIRQKDKILSELYKSEHMKNAGPYARLKFAMDYWCALWFWPIDKADLLPTRSEFFFDMSLILEGTMASVNVHNNIKGGQLSMFPTEMEQLALDIVGTYGTDTIVDIPALRRQNPRLDLAYEIAEKNSFMHWELEFADIFADRKGFDLVIGNPPWIKLIWKEQGVLSDKNPMFAIKDLNAHQTMAHREILLRNEIVKQDYFIDYESITGQQSFLGSKQNYPYLEGAVNLYKNFLPQAWTFTNEQGVSAFIHPEGVYDDPSGNSLRSILYPKLIYHFQFINERLLFEEVGHPSIFSLNVYSNKGSQQFDSIANLFDPITIDRCYEESFDSRIPGLKDENNNWNLNGHPLRIIHTTRKELELYAKVFDDSEDYACARIPSIHISPFLDVLRCFANQNVTISRAERTYQDFMWHETYAQSDGKIARNVHFPTDRLDLICSGPHVGVANPFFKTPRRVCKEKADFDRIDLQLLTEEYLPRSNYQIKCSTEEYVNSCANTPWGSKAVHEYRVFCRKMLNLKQERTLIGAIYPPDVGHTNAVTSFSFGDIDNVAIVAAGFSSLPYDFFIKMLGKTNLHTDNSGKLPLLQGKYVKALCLRALLLNCLTRSYSQIWQTCYVADFRHDLWSKEDVRLSDYTFTNLSENWSMSIPLRSDFERRQALIEIDVLTSMALGMTLDQLKSIYRVQFPVLQQYENDTWYDINGRIIFTNNRGLNNVGFSREEFENNIKVASDGQSSTERLSMIPCLGALLSVL
jgi:hypothetical protein